jgi:hypothetical protein
MVVNDCASGVWVQKWQGGWNTDLPAGRQVFMMMMIFMILLLTDAAD